MSVRIYNEKYDYPITTPSGKVVKPASGRCWSMPKEKFNDLVTDKRVWLGKNESNIPRYKTFLSEINDLILDFFSGSATTAHAV